MDGSSDCSGCVLNLVSFTTALDLSFDRSLPFLLISLELFVNSVHNLGFLPAALVDSSNSSRNFVPSTADSDEHIYFLRNVVFWVRL